MSIKISRISYFSFGFQLDEKKKVLLKKFGLERGLTTKYLLESGLIFNRGFGNISKKGGLTRKGWRKKTGRLRPSKKLCLKVMKN